MQWKFTEYQPPHTLDNPQGTIGGFNKKGVTPLIVLKRKREMALILQNSDLDIVEEKEPVVRVVVGWGVPRGSLGLRGCGFGSYHLLLVDFENEQETPLLCGPLHSGPLRAGLDSPTGQDGWGAFLSGNAICHCRCHLDHVSRVGISDKGPVPQRRCVLNFQMADQGLLYQTQSFVLAPTQPPFSGEGGLSLQCRALSSLFSWI